MHRVASTKNKLLIFISVSLFLLMSLIVINVYITKKEDLLKEERTHKKNTTIAYNSTLHNYEILYKSRLESILSSKDVIKAIKDQNRTKLYSLLKPIWEKMKEDNKDLSIMQFHKPNGESLLRMHDPLRYDDNIAKKRAMCKNIHVNKKMILSYEAGINLLGYRIMIPVFYKSKYIGALEVGIKPGFILNELKNFYDVSGVVFAKQKKIFKKQEADKNKVLIGDYILESNTLSDKKLINFLPKNYNLDGDTRVEKDGKIYDIYLFNHKNFEGKISAKTLVFNNVTSLNKNFYNSILKIVIFSIIFYILVLLIIKYGFEKILNKIDKTNKKLHDSVAFLKSHQLAMDESSIVTKSDLKGIITYVNDNFCDITGYSKEEALGKPHSIVRHPENKKEMFKDIWDTIKSKKVWNGIMKNKGKNGDYWVDTSILPVLDDDGNIVEYIAIRHDITQVILQQKKLDNIANTDTLTGLGSRYKLVQDMAESTSPALAILNVDSFSEINDFYGHEEGDHVIIELCNIIDSIVEDNSYNVYHLQGDEFVIFNKNIDRESFLNYIGEINKKVSKTHIFIGDEELDINLTTAISFEDKKRILSTADMALKVAKKKHENNLVYSDEISLNNEYKNNIKWAKKIKTSIANDNIVPVFQPIINNETGKIEKYECLVRLKDDDKLISPFFFLDISKKTKQYTKITKIMIQKSFDMFKDEEFDFSINLTIEDILNENINDFIIDMLNKYNIGSRLVFEIVESESIEKFEEIYRFINNVKSHGCKIAIDDFGTGYSNFEYLLKLKADFIKIDGSMIKDIYKNEDAKNVVSTIVDFAKRMNIKTIAEFVEDESILEEVNKLGIDYSQGYYFSAAKTEL